MVNFDELVGTRWTGKSELWLDPQGNDADICDCTVAIEDGVIRYTWSYKGEPHTGNLKLHASASGGFDADYVDSWHAKEGMAFQHVAGSPCLLNLIGTYAEDWGWRISLSHRTPSGELVLQMTNITPWGEEGRAVRMVCSRDDG